MISPRTDHLIDLALEEDAGLGDVTSRAIFTPKDRARAFIEAKQELVVCGLEVAARVFARVDPALQITVRARDGERVKRGARMLVRSPTASLTAERTALNFMQLVGHRHWRRFADAVAGSGVLDTRKDHTGLAASKATLCAAAVVTTTARRWKHVLIRTTISPPPGR